MDIISIFQKVVTDPTMSWVLFKNGTCVMLLTPEEDIKNQAIAILKDHGSVVAGTPSGDFEVTKIPDINGWIVTGDYPGIMTYVSSEEAGKKDSDFEVGIFGRTKKEQDATSLEVVHIEDKANT
ncbi:MAG: hypothetical protein AAB557_00770 [Patescibacteria group bacterium]